VTDPAVLAAEITGAVALAAVVGSTATTWLTLRHQRNAEDQRRRHERHMRLLDSGLNATVGRMRTPAAAPTTQWMRSTPCCGTCT